jgi:hypothetical protein
MIGGIGWEGGYVGCWAVSKYGNLTRRNVNNLCSLKKKRFGSGAWIERWESLLSLDVRRYKSCDSIRSTYFTVMRWSENMYFQRYLKKKRDGRRFMRRRSRRSKGSARAHMHRSKNDDWKVHEWRKPKIEMRCGDLFVRTVRRGNMAVFLVRGGEVYKPRRRPRFSSTLSLPTFQILQPQHAMCFSAEFQKHCIAYRMFFCLRPHPKVTSNNNMFSARSPLPRLRSATDVFSCPNPRLEAHRLFVHKMLPWAEKLKSHSVWHWCFSSKLPNTSVWLQLSNLRLWVCIPRFRPLRLFSLTSLLLLRKRLKTPLRCSHVSFCGCSKI